MIDKYFTINNEDSVANVRTRFSRLFPDREITFFKTAANGPVCDGRSIPFSPAVKMKDISRWFREGIADLSGDQSIEGMESEIFHRFRVPVQVADHSTCHSNKFPGNPLQYSEKTTSLAV